ncbi:MAG: hypothetical protein WBP56_10025 [Polyangia bacterium]
MAIEFDSPLGDARDVRRAFDEGLDRRPFGQQARGNEIVIRRLSRSGGSSGGVVDFHHHHRGPGTHPVISRHGFAQRSKARA